VRTKPLTTRSGNNYGRLLTIALITLLWRAGSVNSSTDFESKEDTPRSTSGSTDTKYSPREVLTQIKQGNSDSVLVETACKRLASLAAKNEGELIVKL
jgi:hypothetical protein